MTDMMAKERFELFPCLPVELRNMIWMQALPGPRIVHLVQKLVPVNHGGHSRNQSKIGLASDATPPQILFVCKESHIVATKFYTRAFSTGDAMPQTWFNFSIDTLYLHYMHFVQEIMYTEWDFEYHRFDGVKWANPEDLQKVEKLAVYFGPHEYPWYPWDYNLDVLSSSFTNVKDVQVVSGHYETPFDVVQSELEFIDHAEFEPQSMRFQELRAKYVQKMTSSDQYVHPVHPMIDSSNYDFRSITPMDRSGEYGADLLDPCSKTTTLWGVQNFHPTMIVSRSFVEALEKASQIYESEIEEAIDFQITLQQYQFREDYEKTELELRE